MAGAGSNPAPRCADCGAAINAHAAKYRGVTRCRSCAAKARGMTTEHQSEAARRRHESARENARLAELARRAGLA